MPSINNNVPEESEDKGGPVAEPAPPPAAASPGRARALVVGLLVFSVLFLAFALVWGFSCHGFLWEAVCRYYDIFTNKENIKAALKAAGPLAPILFIIIQALQVVFAPIPGEATGFIGGYLFGGPLGFLYSTIGLTVGSVLAFLIARWLEKHYVERWIPPKILNKFDFLMERQGILISFILFLFPGFPKDYLCFVLGLSRMPFKLFLILSTIGRLPGTLMLTLQGAQVYEGHYYSSLILLAICLVLVLVLSYYRQSVYEWTKRFDHPPEKQGTGEK